MPSIERLPRVVPAAPDKPVRPEATGTQQLMARLALAPTEWTPELAEVTSQGWDAMAANWAGERGAYRPAPLIDVLERGGPFPAGRCLELCCGTGLLTSVIESVWSQPVSVDLSAGMLAHAASRWRARTDASALPFADDAFAAVVLCDGPLFAAEVLRVLAPDGVLVISNALGQGAPYFVETPLLLDALGQVDPRSAFVAVESEASWGSWVVLRRLEGV